MKKLSFLLAFFLLLGCSHNQTVADENYTSKENKDHQENSVSFFRNDNFALRETSKPNDKNEKIARKNKADNNKGLSHQKEKVILDVPLIKQNPELKYGCEVTSLAMVLQYAGVDTNKMDLFKSIKKDLDPLVKSNDDILKWGDPADGFVGDMTGNNRGYAVFDQPITDLTNQYLPGKAINLSKKNFNDILNHVGSGFPVVVWTTGIINSLIGGNRGNTARKS